MTAAKNKILVPVEKPTHRQGKYVLAAYWIGIAFIYFSVDLFVDLYTTTDFIAVAGYSAIIALPLAALNLYYMRKDVFGKWYSYVLAPLITFGLYLGCTYFNALNFDLLLSAAFQPTSVQEMPVKNVDQVFARKAGFIHTDVDLLYREKPVVFQGTRTSYFLLKDKKMLRASVGRTYFGNLFIIGLQVPASERWTARKAYLQNWFHRYRWVLIVLAGMVVLSSLKNRFFPKKISGPTTSIHPYRKFFDIVLYVFLGVFGLMILILLLAYFFL